MTLLPFVVHFSVQASHGSARPSCCSTFITNLTQVLPRVPKAHSVSASFLRTQTDHFAKASLKKNPKSVSELKHSKQSEAAKIAL